MLMVIPLVGGIGESPSIAPASAVLPFPTLSMLLLHLGPSPTELGLASEPFSTSGSR